MRDELAFFLIRYPTYDTVSGSSHSSMSEISVPGRFSGAWMRHGLRNRAFVAFAGGFLMKLSLALVPEDSNPSGGGEEVKLACDDDRACAHVISLNL